MKKLSLIIITILILLTSMLFSSCDDVKTNEENNNQASTAETTVTEYNNANTTTINSSETTHVHAYGQWVTVTDSTCQQEGSKARVCSCGSKETERLEKIPCNYVDNICTMCKNKEQIAFVPDYAEGQANVVGSDNAALNYTSQAEYIYYSNGNKIQKVKKNGTAAKSVYTVSSGDVFNVNVAGDWIYFYCRGNTIAKSYIAKVRTDGSGFEKIVSSLYVYEMLVVNDTVYYTTITENWEYVEYGKDVFPLYSVSINGGSSKQIHDGAVSNLVADATYLYFSHYTENDDNTICRIKHSNMNKNVLLKNTETLTLSLENSKLYFFALNQYDSYTLTIASISTSGGQYTTYGKMDCVDSFFHVIGNKAYFLGAESFSEENPEPEFGLLEYDMNAKTLNLIHKYEGDGEFVGVFDTLIFEPYNYNTEKLEYIEIYNYRTGVFQKIKVS